MHQLRVIALALCVTGACADSTTAPPRPASAYAPSLALVPLDRFGIGAGGIGNACKAPEYRQFDFWVGNWAIENVQGAPIGGSVVSSVLGGCAVLENYLNGVGRSLNAYDEATGTWHQFYVSAGGGVSMLRGSFRSDSMVLEEQRGNVLLDRWAWTTLPDGSVRQHERLFFTNGNILEGFHGIYRRRQAPLVFPAPPTGVCARAASRQFDFLLGTWDVYHGSAPGRDGAQGQLVVQAGSGGCLIEETITGPASFEGLSYASWHPQQQRWVRTYMDTDGRYIRFFGTLQGTRMVMTGNRLGADGGLVVIRLTWEPETADRVHQRWEFSTDGGASFEARQQYTFVRR